MLLHEELVYLSIDDRKNKLSVSQSILNQAIAGAVLMDALFDGLVTIENKKMYITEKLQDNPFHERFFVLEKMDGKPVKSVLKKLAGEASVTSAIEALSAKQLISIQEEKVLLLFTTKNYHLAEPERKQLLVKTIKEEIMSYEGEPSNRLFSLASLIEVTKLDRHLFPQEYKDMKKRLKEIRKSDVIAQSVYQIIKDTETMMVVITAGAVAATTSN
ncbi:GOLPH3/VPS74 family protein [Thalassobacillus hwangdonensis]|uniref:GPP34 family phosphoprotein n=1 Tax=Thalassobacillus hwangdonensis TaxID=546108 RepID=A0ABW3L8W2_9BACI